MLEILLYINALVFPDPPIIIAHSESERNHLAEPVSKNSLVWTPLITIKYQVNLEQKKVKPEFHFIL